MMDLIRDRKGLIVTAAIILAAILYLQFGRGDSGTPTKQRSEILKPVDQANDAAATVVLQSGSVAMESMFAQTGSYAGGASGAAAVEPNIQWVAGGAASAASNQISVVAADATSYTIATTGAAGTTYTYAKTPTGQVVKACGPGCSW